MMKQIQFAGLTLGVALALALAPAGSEAQNTARPVNSIPVSVANGKVVVGSSTQARVASSASLTWQLQTEGYRFTDSSIDFGSAADSFTCSAFSKGQMVKCVRNSGSASGSGSYTVSVQATSGPPPGASQPTGVIMID